MVTPGEIPGWLARQYPFQLRSLRTSGGAGMSFVDEGGRGDEAVLMLHGNPTWSFYYRDLIRDLAPEIRCVAPDHVGMGLSDKPGDYDYSLASRIADIEALVAGIGLRRVHLVVHDWGGAIGFGFAARRPDLVGRIVILNTAAFYLPRIPLRIAVCRIPGIGALLVRGLNGFAVAATRMAMNRRRLTGDQRRGYLFPYDSWGHRVGIHAFVRDIPMEDGNPSRAALDETARLLPSFAANVRLILWGGRDFCFNDLFLARWRGLYPQAPWERYSDAGHYVLEDAGAEARARIRAALLD